MVPQEVVLFLTLEVVPKLTLERPKSGTKTNSPAYIYIYLSLFFLGGGCLILNCRFLLWGIFPKSDASWGIFMPRNRRQDCNMLMARSGVSCQDPIGGALSVCR